jgi:hypothetical protein
MPNVAGVPGAFRALAQPAGSIFLYILFLKRNAIVRLQNIGTKKKSNMPSIKTGRSLAASKIMRTAIKVRQ